MKSKTKSEVHDLFSSFKIRSFKHCKVNQARYFLYTKFILLLQCEF